ncbi:MAG TPA: hypothetical protein VFL83_10085 [Anaeromyxobacter sp.]|nr:hypothetical protein [Anaeromyxobacter sp.]
MGHRVSNAIAAATFALFAPALALAEDAALPLSARARLEWLTAAGTTVPRDTRVNPDNAVLRLPQAAGSTELRPDLRLEAGRDLRGYVRPRLLLQVQKPRVAGAWQPETSDASVEWTELYASWQADERVAVAYGLQNFQWGPADLVSPSNRIFHVTGFFRDPLYVVRGRHLARVNLSAGRAWSAVLLAEVGSNGERPFVAGEPFEPKAQAKLEWSDPGGRGYAAVTAGAGRDSRGFFGGYASVGIGDALSVYADSVTQLGSRGWYPIDDGAGGARFEHALAGAGLRTLALGGVRYTFEGGTDLRLEYLFDEAGWTPAQLGLAERAAAAPPGLPPDPAAVEAWLDPGFEVVGRQHAYASLTVPDLPPRKRTAVALRWLQALEDGSAAAFATASYDAADAVVLFASATATWGGDHGALSRLARASALAGATVSW